MQRGDFMSLNIYRNIKDIPSGMNYIASNDLFFEAQGNIENSELSNEILMTIDNATFINGSAFKGRFGKDDLQPKSNLSTGTKTLFNILQNPDVCFNVAECGNNALEFMFKIQNGNILWEYPVVCLKNDISCDILYNGQKYSRAFDFLRDTMGRK
jgi:hypothetical protein